MRRIEIEVPGQKIQKSSEECSIHDKDVGVVSETLVFDEQSVIGCM
jgi:hypothetical protein